MLAELRNNRPRGLVTHRDHSDERFRQAPQLQSAVLM